MKHKHLIEWAQDIVENVRWRDLPRGAQRIPTAIRRGAEVESGTHTMLERLALLVALYAKRKLSPTKVVHQKHPSSQSVNLFFGDAAVLMDLRTSSNGVNALMFIELPARSYIPDKQVRAIQAMLRTHGKVSHRLQYGLQMQGLDDRVETFELEVRLKLPEDARLADAPHRGQLGKLLKATKVAGAVAKKYSKRR